jgi:predicted  nucleic acid-binding Zn-ribbon protein
MTRPVPKPGPKPGPRPGPKPGAGQVAPTVAAAVRPSDPARFGRVDDDGVVWVTDGDGERRVGEWKAGTPAEGLAHFGRRYDDLATTVSQLEARLTAHPEESARIGDDASKLRDGLSTAEVVGDLAALDRRLDALTERATATGEDEAVRRQRRREEAVARKEALIAEAEELAGADHDGPAAWREAGDRFTSVLDRWKGVHGIDKRTDDALWKRYRAAREKFNERRSGHFADLDRQRDRVRVDKEKLVERAERLQNSTDWATTARAYRDLMSEWKAAGRAHRADDDRLWERFRAAQDVFFAAKEEDNRRRDGEFAGNAEQKQALLDEYDGRIDPSAGLDRARDLLRELEEKWDAIGFVPRDRVREFDDKLGALQSRVTDYADAQWRQTDPELQSRLDQFRDRAARFTADADAAEKSGRTKKAAELRAQAAQWEEWAATAAASADGTTPEDGQEA